jgi:hypothetical protein
MTRMGDDRRQGILDAKLTECALVNGTAPCRGVRDVEVRPNWFLLVHTKGKRPRHRLIPMNGPVRATLQKVINSRTRLVGSVTSLAHLHLWVEIKSKAKLMESHENSEIRVVPRAGVEPVLSDNGF